MSTNDLGDSVIGLSRRMPDVVFLNPHQHESITAIVRPSSGYFLVEGLMILPLQSMRPVFSPSRQFLASVIFCFGKTIKAGPLPPTG